MLIEQKTKALLLSILLFGADIAAAQESTWNGRAALERVHPVVLFAASGAVGETAQHVLDRIRESIAGNDPRALQPYLATKVYLSLLTGKEGYFSADQSYFIIKNFFLTYTPVAFSYTNSACASENPYGVGTLQYIARGQRGKAQVFISLSRSDDDWRISQITVTSR